MGIVTKSPTLAFFAGLISHHIMDMIPHWDPGSFYFPFKQHKLNMRDYSIAAIDVLTAIIVGWLLYRYINYSQLQSVALWGMIGAALPDVWHNIPLWQKISHNWPITNVWYRFHYMFHATINPDYWWFGVLNQIVVALIGWWIVYGVVENMSRLIGSLPIT